MIKSFIALMQQVKAYHKVLLLAIMGLLITRASEGVIYKFIVPQTLDAGFIAKDLNFLQQLPWLILGVLLLYGVGEFFAKFMLGFVGRSVVRDYRIKLLTHLLQVPVSYYKQHPSGRLLAKINYDTEQIAIAVSDAIREFLSSIIAISVLVAVTFSISWQVSLGCLIVLPLTAYYLKIMSKFMRRYSLRVQQTMGDLTQVANEVINSYQTIRIYHGEQYEIGRIKQVVNNNRKQELKIFLLTAISSPVMHLIAGGVLVGFILLVSLNVINLTPGQVFGLLGAMFALIRPLKQITVVNNVFQKGLAAIQSMNDLLNVVPEHSASASNKLIANVRGEIKFSKVNFSYANSNKGNDNIDNKLALKNINLTIKPGQILALIGPSGSGKSTLVSLLLRFFIPQSGEILLDGINIQSLNLFNLRQQFAMVTQNVILFNDTVANNIAYGTKDIKDINQQEIIKAAKAAYALEFIEKLPNGFDTNIGENGNLLSGGQRQRLAIARAFLKNAPILILDEATSALDQQAEQQIQLAMQQLMQNKTTIIIAHRASTVKQADKVLVLKQGELVGSENWYAENMV